MRLYCLENPVNSGNSVLGGSDCRIDHGYLAGGVMERLNERGVLYVAFAKKTLTIKAKNHIVIPVESGLKGRDQFFK